MGIDEDNHVVVVHHGDFFLFCRAKNPYLPPGLLKKQMIGGGRGKNSNRATGVTGSQRTSSSRIRGGGGKSAYTTIAVISMSSLFLGL